MPPENDDAGNATSEPDRADCARANCPAQLHPAHGRGRPDPPWPSMLLANEGIAQTTTTLPTAGHVAAAVLKADLVAGRGAPEPALRRRHQGAGRDAHLPSRWRLGHRGNLIPMLAEASPIVQRRPRVDGPVICRLRSVPWHGPWFDRRRRGLHQVRRRPGDRHGDGQRYPGTSRSRGRHHRARRSWRKPTPFWAEPLVGSFGMILPRSTCSPTTSAPSRARPRPTSNRSAPAEHVHRLQAGRHGALPWPTRTTTNANQPFFDAVEIKGGGDAPDAQRAGAPNRRIRLCWNLAVGDDILKRLEAGRGQARFLKGSDIEFVILNVTGPVDRGRRRRSSVRAGTRRSPTKAVRDAMNPAHRPYRVERVHLRPRRRRDRQP